MTEYYEYLGSIEGTSVDHEGTLRVALDELNVTLVYRADTGQYEMLRWAEGELE